MLRMEKNRMLGKTINVDKRETVLIISFVFILVGEESWKIELMTLLAFLSMGQSNMKTVLKVLFGVVLILQRIPGRDAKENYQLDIVENGTAFNETIEIDDEQKTVTYKVPPHNSLKETDYLVDYKHGYFASRMPDRNVCFVQRFPTADEPSLQKTKESLKLLKYYKSRTNTSVPVTAVEKIVKVVRKIPRQKLSLKIGNFCGDNAIYEVKEEDMPRKYRRSIGKRAKRYTFSLQLHPKFSLGEAANSLPNDLFLCKRMSEYKTIIQNCGRTGGNLRAGCGLKTRSCRYLVHCDVVRDGKGMVARDTQGNSVSIECKEDHEFTHAWCCDLVPCQ